MRRRILTLAAVVVTAMTLLVPSFASAAQSDTLPENVILDESERDARAYIRVDEECLRTSIHVGLSNLTQSWNDGSNPSYPLVSLFAYQENTCLDETVFAIEFYSEEMGFKLSDTLSGATLVGQATVNNIFGDEELFVDMAVMWMPDGPLNADAYTDELVVLNPATGQQVTALAETTDIYREAKVSGAITIGEQTFEFRVSGDDAFFFGYDNTWTALP